MVHCTLAALLRTQGWQTHIKVYLIDGHIIIQDTACGNDAISSAHLSCILQCGIVVVSFETVGEVLSNVLAVGYELSGQY